MNKTILLRGIAILFIGFLLRFAISCCNPNNGTDFTERLAETQLKILDASGLGQPIVVDQRVQRESLAFELDYIYELIAQNRGLQIDEFGFTNATAQCDDYDNYYLESQIRQVRIFYISNGNEVEITNDMRVLAYNSFYSFPEYIEWIIYDENSKLSPSLFQSVRANRYPNKLQFKAVVELFDGNMIENVTNEIDLI